MNARIAAEQTESRADQADARLKPELAALTAADLTRMNVDVAKTAQQVLARLPKLRALGGELRTVLPAFDQRLFDKLEDCALVLAAAQARYTAEAENAHATPSPLRQATKLRKILIADAVALCERGYLKPSQFSKVKLLTGYESTARDLDTLRGLLRRALPNIQGKSAVTLAELELAAALSAELRLVLEERKQTQPVADRTNDERARVFTLLYRTYTEVQRTIRYLRASEGDADALIPPLRGRPRRRGNPKHIA